MTDSKVSVLLVDDDFAILDSLRLLLEYDGYKVRVAQNGDETFEILNNFKPDIIFLDITLPKMNGFEICKIIKSNKETKNIPVVFLTGLGSEVEMKLQSLMVGAVDYIAKPYEKDDLTQKIKFHVNKP